MNILNKIIYSSQNPAKISLTLKSFVPFVFAILPIIGVVNIGENDLILAVDGILAILSGVGMIYGFARKFV